MKHKPLNADEKAVARELAMRLRADALFEKNTVKAPAMVSVAKLLERHGALSAGTPKPGRALHVLDVMTVKGWSRTRAAKWVLGLQAWEADNGEEWRKRFAKARSDASRNALRVEREEAIAMYASSISPNAAARLAAAALRAKETEEEPPA